MNDEPEGEIVRKNRAVHHEYLCQACAHRYHRDCEGACIYCSIPCQCACQRWVVPLSTVEKT